MLAGLTIRAVGCAAAGATVDLIPQLESKQSTHIGPSISTTPKRKEFYSSPALGCRLAPSTFAWTAR